MNAKDKALQLVQRLIDNAYSEDCEGLYTPTAKKAALICVDEILDSLGRVESEDRTIKDEELLWHEVKQEIEKL